jgi:hypothetical protein
MRIAVLLSMLCLLLPVAATAGRGAPPPPPPFPKISGQWSHVEINVTIRRVPHTLTLDRGRIIQASPTQITLREAGGVNWPIPIDQNTLVVVRGLASFSTDLKKKMNVETMRIDNGPAVRVRTTR